MARLLITKNITDGVWSVGFSLDYKALSESDKQLVSQFGEPLIDTGGTFLAGTPEEYTLPSNFIRIFSELPFTQSFDSKSTTFATATLSKVTEFKVVFLSRFDAALATLRASVDNFTGEELHENRG